MKRAILILAVVAAILPATASADVAATPAPVDVTNTPLIAQALADASLYWSIEEPTLEVTCGPSDPLTVTVEPMAVVESYHNATAQSMFGGCQIELSPWIYAALIGEPDPANDAVSIPAKTCPAWIGPDVTQCYTAHSLHGKWGRAYAASVITHEYGILLTVDDLGLDGQPFPDEIGWGVVTTLPIMSFAGNYDNPLCELRVRGWAHLDATDRAWLATHGIDHEGRR